MHFGSFWHILFLKCLNHLKSLQTLGDGQDPYFARLEWRRSSLFRDEIHDLPRGTSQIPRPLYPLSIIIQCFSSMNIAQYNLVLHSGAKLRGFRNRMKSTCVISCVRGAQAFLVMRGAQTGLHNRMDVKLITIKDSRPSYDDTCNLDGNFYDFDLKWVLKLDVGLWELRCRPRVTKCFFRISQILSWKKCHGSGVVQAAILAWYLYLNCWNTWRPSIFQILSYLKNPNIGKSLVFAGVKCPPCKAANHFATWILAKSYEVHALHILGLLKHFHPLFHQELLHDDFTGESC